MPVDWHISDEDWVELALESGGPYRKHLSECNNRRRLRLLWDHRHRLDDEALSDFFFTLTGNKHVASDILLQIAAIAYPDYLSLDVLWVLASHPATPKPIIEGLSRIDNWAIHDEILQRSDVSVSMLRRLLSNKDLHKDDNLLDGVPQLARTERLPDDIYRCIADNSADPSTWRSLAENQSVSPDLLARLSLTAGHEAAASREFAVSPMYSSSWSAVVRAAVARNPNTRPSTLSFLAFDENDKVRIAASEAISEIRERGQPLEADAEHDRIVAICRQPAIGDSEIWHVMQNGRLGHCAQVLDHPSATEQHFLFAIEHIDQAVAQAAAKSRYISAEALDRALRSPVDDVRRSAAANRNVSADQLGLALKDEEPEVRIAAIINENLPIRMIREMLDDPEDYVRGAAYATLDNRGHGWEEAGAPSEEEIWNWAFASESFREKDFERRLIANVETTRAAYSAGK